MKVFNIFKRKAIPTAKIISLPSQKERLIKRILEIRNSGSDSDGIHTMTQEVKISEDDYFLMGCDCSCAKRNYPDIKREERELSRWFTGGDDLDGSRFWNSHGTHRKDGTIHVDSFLSGLPKPQYQSAPEEVAWHYRRVKELRALEIPNEERIKIMTEEAKRNPWNKGETQ